MQKISAVVYCLVLLQFGCDKGLEPGSVITPGFGGEIYYNSAIPLKPPLDSLFDLRVVAVPYFPVDTSFYVIFRKIINDTIAYSPASIPTADSGKTVSYEMLVKPKSYYYIAVVQQFGPDVFSQWRVVGIYGYSAASPSPKPVTVPSGGFIKGINIVVDFKNLPPQPFK
jgi:hypothetical protein